MTQQQMDDIGRIVASKHRYAVLRSLGEEDMTPTGVYEVNDRMTRGKVSQMLRELREMGSIELLVEDGRRKGRIHGITEKGQEQLDYIDEHRPNMVPAEPGECPICGHEHDPEGE